MARPPVTRKPIPQDKQVWKNEVWGIVRYIKRVEKYDLSQGNKWVEAQRDYFITRLNDLMDNPPGQRMVTPAMRAALKKATCRES